MTASSGARGRHECAEEERHKIERLATLEIEAWLWAYKREHGLSDTSMLAALGAVQAQLLRYLDRDDEERRTGFRHQMAGE